MVQDSLCHVHSLGLTPLTLPLGKDISAKVLCRLGRSTLAQRSLDHAHRVRQTLMFGAGQICEQKQLHQIHTQVSSRHSQSIALVVRLQTEVGFATVTQKSIELRAGHGWDPTQVLVLDVLVERGQSSVILIVHFQFAFQHQILGRLQGEVVIRGILKDNVQGCLMGQSRQELHVGAIALQGLEHIQERLGLVEAGDMNRSNLGQHGVKGQRSETIGVGT